MNGYIKDNNKNFIKLNRCIMENWLWTKKPFSEGQAWIDMLMLTTHTTTKEMFRGNLVEKKRGDLNVSMLFLSERWGWSRKRVKHFLEQLEKDEMVTTHITSQRTVITIENYSNYQDKPTPKGTLKGTPNDTPNDTAEEHQTTHNKERYKKDKESYKNVFIRANTHPYGKLKNVYLTDSEYAEIQEYQNYNILLDEVGTWLLNNNRNNHYGTMITFAKTNSYKKKPKPEPPKEPIKAEPMPKEVREKMKNLGMIKQEE